MTAFLTDAPAQPVLPASDSDGPRPPAAHPDRRRQPAGSLRPEDKLAGHATDAAARQRRSCDGATRRPRRAGRRRTVPACRAEEVAPGRAAGGCSDTTPAAQSLLVHTHGRMARDVHPRERPRPRGNARKTRGRTRRPQRHRAGRTASLGPHRLTPRARPSRSDRAAPGEDGTAGRGVLPHPEEARVTRVCTHDGSGGRPSEKVHFTGCLSEEREEIGASTFCWRCIFLVGRFHRSLQKCHQPMKDGKEHRIRSFGTVQGAPLQGPPRPGRGPEPQAQRGRRPPSPGTLRCLRSRFFPLTTGSHERPPLVSYL